MAELFSDSGQMGQMESAKSPRIDICTFNELNKRVKRFDEFSNGR